MELMSATRGTPSTCGNLDKLSAEDGVVLADVDVAGILIIVDGVHVRDVGEVLSLLEATMFTSPNLAASLAARFEKLPVTR